MTPLPVVDCTGCGACCRHMARPSYLRSHLPGQRWADDEIWAAMPQELRAAVEQDYEDRPDIDDVPCMWLTADGRCQHHEHRPSVCRDFDVGGTDCHDARERVLCRH